MSKICLGCNQNKSTKDFWKNQSRCKTCLKAKNKERYEQNKQTILKKYTKKYKNDENFRQKKLDYAKKHRTERNHVYKNNQLMNKFGISLEDYNNMLTKQKGTCKICDNICVTGRQLAVDHCHKTNKIRGLLCSRCNSLLGQARDNTKILKRAINYLEENND